MVEGGLWVETLGPLRAYGGKGELALGPPKQRAVFAVLALNANEVVSRDYLIDNIWNVPPPATAAGSVYTYVSGLRQALTRVGEALTSSGSGYTLLLDREKLDVVRVDRLAERARVSRAEGNTGSAIAALDEALACWRSSPPLSDLAAPFAVEYRARMLELRIKLLTERAELLLGIGRAADIVDQLRGHVAASPSHERLRVMLMTALHRSGRTADALGEYHAIRRLLAEDFGIDPSTELQSLYFSILRDNPDVRTTSAITQPPASTMAPAPPAQLPQSSGRFVGRAASVLQVLDAASTAPTANGGDDHVRTPRIVMIVGGGGIGKTALAVRCGHLLAARFPDGQLFVNLRGFGPNHSALSPAEALHHLLTSLNVGTVPADKGQRSTLWRNIVRDKKMLIILDNAESAEQVEELLPGNGSSFVVVTSRNQLSGLAVRYSAPRVSLSPLTMGESMAMLSDSIGSAQLEAELPAAQRLAELCDHLPLALRIAAKQATVRPRSRIADLVADLQDVRRRLDALQTSDDELQSVRAVLSWSYVSLDDRAARAFGTLGLFPGVSIVPEAASALLSLPLPETNTVLQRLVAQHLVETTGSRYWMHDLTRIYAEEVSRSRVTTASRLRALERVLQWYVRTLTLDSSLNGAELPFTLDLDPPYKPLRLGDKNELVAWCSREWGNLQQLVGTAHRTGLHDQAWQLAYQLFDYFYAAGQTRQWVDTLRTGIRSAEALKNQRGQAVLYNHLSVAYSRMGQNTAAIQQLRRGLQLLADPDDVLRASILGNLASTLREAKDYAGALPYAREALDLARRSGREYYEAGCLDVLCELHTELGEFNESLRYGRSGLLVARRCRESLLEANILINLGASEFGLGHAEAAQRHFQDAVSLSESGGDRYHEALALFGLAKVRHAGSAPELASELAGRALALLQGLGAEEATEVAEFLGALLADP